MNNLLVRHFNWVLHIGIILPEVKAVTILYLILVGLGIAERSLEDLCVLGLSLVLFLLGKGEWVIAQF
jgi:hypothetical protein